MKIKHTAQKETDWKTFESILLYFLANYSVMILIYIN